jgi:hypothetical protein
MQWGDLNISFVGKNIVHFNTTKKLKIRNAKDLFDKLRWCGSLRKKESKPIMFYIMGQP